MKVYEVCIVGEEDGIAIATNRKIKIHKNPKACDHITLELLTGYDEHSPIVDLIID